MLEQLCLKDKYWRKVAYNICRDRMIADDLVQEMYLIFHNFNKDKIINDWYIVITIRNLYLCNKKKDSVLKSLSEIDKPVIQDFFEFDFKTLETKHQEKIVSNLKWWEKELITMTHDKSNREIQRECGFNREFIRRTLIKVKENAKQKA